MIDDSNSQLSDFDIFWISRAIEISKSSAKGGGSPFGAIVADRARIFGEGSNETVAKESPIRHAEIVALEAALLTTSGVLPPTTTLYSSCAPCIMCLGAAFYAGVRRVVYGISISDVIPLGSGDPNIEPEFVNKNLGLGFQLYGGILRSDALKVVNAIFEERGYL